MLDFFHRRPFHYLLLLTFSSTLFLINLGAPSLWDIDEGNNAEAAREMMVSGNWVVPTFNYKLRSDKPALLYWCEIAAYRYFGVNEFAARLPSALAALATVLVVYELGRRMFDPATGLLAGLVLASSIGCCAAAHFANPDALLLLFTTLTLTLFWIERETGRGPWLIAAGASTGFAVLAKGPVGVALPVLVALLFLVRTGGWRRVSPRYLLWTGLAMFAVAVPWYAWVGAETKFVFLRDFILTHNAGRFRASMEGHGGPVFYYLLTLIVGFFPWSAFLALACWASSGSRARADGRVARSERSEGRTVAPESGRRSTPVKDSGRATQPDGEGMDGSHAHAKPWAWRPQDDRYWFLWCWIATHVIFFSLSATKLPNYVLPAYPAVALLIARFFERWRRREVVVAKWLWLACLSTLAVMGVAIGLGLAIAGRGLPTSSWHARVFPGLESWFLIGFVPVAGAVALWRLSRRDQRRGVIVGCVAIATLLAASLAAGGALAVDRFKAGKPLTQAYQEVQSQPEIRVGCYGYFQPSLVFYGRREVIRFTRADDVLEFLRYPVPVYLFVPADDWNQLEPRAQCPCRVVARHGDLYHRGEILVVANRP